jgi:uncharacterized membrane protein
MTMPYCCQCGREVGKHDLFCANCGSRQPAAAATPIDPLAGVSNRTAALLCYIPMVGWIAAIVVLASVRFRQDARTRFHAFQGFYLFVVWLIVDWVLSPIFSFASPWHHGGPALLKAAVFGAWIFMIIKVAQEETFKLPLVGDLAEKSVSEQRL